MIMKNRGFTLIEMMITLAIGTILLTWAIPSFQTIIQQNRLSTEANELISALNLARSEAVKRGTDVVVTPVGTWAGGWNMTTVDPVLGAITLKVGDGVSGSLALTGGPANFTFKASGTRATTTEETFTLCDSAVAGGKGREIKVSPLGRPRVDSDFTCP